MCVARRSPWLVAAAAWALRGVDSGEAACGKVFIYDLPPALYDLRWRPSPTPGATPRERLAPFASVEEVFGSEHVEKSRSCEGLDDHAFESLYGRSSGARRSSFCTARRRAAGARGRWTRSEADIFLVPVLPKAKSGGGWVAACNATGADERSLVKALPHLNERTAHRHVMVVAKGLASAKTCDWFLEPRTLLKRAVRVAYSAKVMLPKSDFDAARTKPRYGPAHLPYVPRSAVYYDRTLPAGDELRAELFVAPNLVSIPYATSVHGARAAGDVGERAPWSRRHHRNLLMSFQGKLGREAGSHRGATNGTFIVDKHYGAAVRRPDLRGRAGELLPRRFDRLPRAVQCFLGLGTTSFHPETMELAKAKSVFCLEPLGDSPYRKSIWDSLSLGCIPVVFSLYSEITAPWHWGPWRNASRVYVPEARLNDDAFDLVDHLRSIPEADVKAMQATIAHHARSIQIAVDDVPHDAFETLVRRLVAEVEAHEASPGFPAPFDPGETGQWLDVGTH
ncbi:hypothetical protein JL722_14845 [Aureococcus anophagefferens]|nr:hypothetical protein JL722_14845 [Aureococcus anophagefferens]